METVVCVSGFLLLLFSTGAQLRQYPEDVPDGELICRVAGGSMRFQAGFLYPTFMWLYRVCTDGDLLLANDTMDFTSKPDGYEVELIEADLFVMSNLTMSQTGDYRLDWRVGLIVFRTSYHLIVCAAGHEEEKETVYNGDDAVVCRMDSPLGNGYSLQVHRTLKYKDFVGFDQSYTLVLDTKSSLEPLEEDLSGRMQVDLSTSLVTLSGVTRLDYHFYCTVWRGDQCQSYKTKSLSVEGNSVFAHAEENITLPCISKGAPPRGKWGLIEVEWETPTDHPEVKYHTQNGNHSLLIPSVSQQHSGEYTCHRKNIWKDKYKIQTFYLYVCPLVSPLDVMFSHGESVRLNYTPHLDFSSVDGIMWYRQKVLKPQVLILDSRKGSTSLPEDLRGRVSLRGQVTWRGRETEGGKLTEGERLTNSPLIFSSLTAEDSGLYTWRVYERVILLPNNESKYVCSEGSIRLVYLEHPFGVRSPFYRAYVPLMGCGLLGLVAAVIWFKLRSRRGEQTSGHQSREGQQSGDKDLHEEVEMAEISG